MDQQEATKILNAHPKIVIYGKKDCKFCESAKSAFSSVELPYEYYSLSDSLCIGTNEVGEPMNIRSTWRDDGMVELRAKWAMCGEPTPFILVDGTGYKNLSAALEAVHYQERKKIIVARKKNAQSPDQRPSA